MAAPSEAFQPTGKEVPFGAGRFLLSHRLGNGSFGDIFEGYDRLSRRIVAVKLERKKARYPQLSYESKVYRVLHQSPVGHGESAAKSVFADQANGENNAQNSAGTTAGETDGATSRQVEGLLNPHTVVGIPQIYYFDSEGDYNIMVMEMCGPSLEDVFNYCHRRFSLKTVLMIADQLLHRIQYFHEKGFVHRDIKPENFVFGCRGKAHILYIIDYGLSKLYWEVKKNSHIPFAEGRPLTGTARYCSANVHRGYEQSRRDDLESIGFLFIYFLQSSLPWQGIQAKDQQLKTIKIGEKKIATPLEELCKGLPKEFLKYCQYCRAMTFTQKPDYEYLRRLFRGLGKRLGLTLSASVDIAATAAVANSSANPLADRQNPLSSPPTLSAGEGSVNNSHMPSAVSAETGSHPDRSPRTVAAQLLSQGDEGNPMRGPYDWEFDWFDKRQGEVRVGLAEHRRKQRSQASSQVRLTGSMNGLGGELHIEDVSGADGLNTVEKVSEGGSKRPLFKGNGTTAATSGVAS